MVTDTVARQLALALPGAVEQDHHGFPSLRVAGRIFATLPSPDRLRAMLDDTASAPQPRTGRNRAASSTGASASRVSRSTSSTPTSLSSATSSPRHGTTRTPATC